MSYTDGFRKVFAPYSGKLNRDETFAAAEAAGYEVVSWNGEIWCSTGCGNWYKTILRIEDFKF